MRHFSISCHATLDAVAKVSLPTNALKIGTSDWQEIAIFLPDGVDAQPIVDAFNEAMEAAKPKQVAA